MKQMPILLNRFLINLKQAGEVLDADWQVDTAHPISMSSWHNDTNGTIFRAQLQIGDTSEDDDEIQDSPLNLLYFACIVLAQRSYFSLRQIYTLECQITLSLSLYKHMSNCSPINR